MKSKNINRKSEKGSVLLTTIMLLFILSIIVIMGSNNSTLEVKLSGNEKCIDQMRSNAESAALAGIASFDALLSAEKKFHDYTSAWTDPERPDWYHKGGENNLAATSSTLALQAAKDFAEIFYHNNFENKLASDPDDHWVLGGCDGVGVCAAGSCDYVIERLNRDTVPVLKAPDNEGIGRLDNAKFMVIDTGKSGPMKNTMDASSDAGESDHQLLIAGVDESCGGKYMVQIAIIRSF